MRARLDALVGILSLFLFIVLFSSCEKKLQKRSVNHKGNTLINGEHILSSPVLSKENQDKLTPKDVFDTLRDGNLEFVEDNLTVRSNTARVRATAIGQQPQAAVLSCIDSRVPVEDIFHRGIGDLFVVNIAGNIVNDDIVGSMEYACKVAGAKLIVVLGHDHCGVIKSAIDGVEIGSMTGLMAHMQPAVKQATVSFGNSQTSKNPIFVEAVCEYNVRLSILELRKKSPILKEMETKGEIRMVGGIYDIKTGRVNFVVE